MLRLRRLHRLSRADLETVIKDIVILREQAKQISEEMGTRYSETLLLLILRETVILNRKIDSLLQQVQILVKKETT